MTRDVCIDPAGAFHECASPMDGAVGLSIDGAPVAAATQSLLYARIAHNGTIGVVVGQGGGQYGQTSGTILATSAGGWTRLGSSNGQNPVAIEWLADVKLFVVFAVMTGPTGEALVRQYTLDAAGAVTFDAPYPMRPTGSSQGFSDCVNGVPIWLDDHRVEMHGGRPFSQPMTRGGLTLGQSDPVPVAVWDGGRYLVAYDHDPGPLQPRLAVSGDQVRIALSSAPDIRILTEDDLIDYVPPPIRIPTPVLLHRVSIAPFKDPDHLTAADAEVVVNRATQQAMRPAWAAEDSIDSVRGPLRGIYTEATTVSDMHRVITKAAAIGVRVAFCHDGTAVDLALVDLLRPWDEVWLECYRTKAETLARSIDRWDANLGALLAAWPHAIGLIPQDYDQGGIGTAEVWTVQETLDALEAIPALANRSARIVTLAPFEVLRANGATAHPELMEWTRRLVAAPPGLPTLEPIAPIHPPPPPPPPPPPHPPGPPSPSPIQEEHTVKIGDKFIFRKFGSNEPWIQAEVADSYDTGIGFFSTKLRQDVPAVNARNGEIAHFSAITGQFDGSQPLEQDGKKGGADERCFFSTPNIMVAQPSDRGAFEPFEIIAIK